VRVAALVEPQHTVLDVGCGRGGWADDPVRLRRELRSFKRRARQVVGIDVDEGARANPFLDDFRLIEGDRWPVDDGSVDVLVSDYVVEHLTDPDRFFGECARVLRTGGHLCLRTPNAYSYVGLLARLVPNRLHARIVGRTQESHRTEGDVFPVVYRCNTRRRLRAALDRHGFDHHVYAHEAEPAYAAFSSLFYALGVAYQRAAPSAVRSTLLAYARKA
jgi:SAM-dependent methyltransferase